MQRAEEDAAFEAKRSEEERARVNAMEEEAAAKRREEEAAQALAGARATALITVQAVDDDPNIVTELESWIQFTTNPNAIEDPSSREVAAKLATDGDLMNRIKESHAAAQGKLALKAQLESAVQSRNMQAVKDVYGVCEKMGIVEAKFMGASAAMAKYLLMPEEMLKQLSVSSGPYEDAMFKHFEAKDFV